MALNLLLLQRHLQAGLIWVEQPAWPLLADWLAGRGLPLSSEQQRICQTQTDSAWQRLALASGWLLLAPDWGILPSADPMWRSEFGQLAEYLGQAGQLQDPERQEELIRWWLRTCGQELVGETPAQAQARWEVISSQEAARLQQQVQARRQRARAIQQALQRAKALQDE